MPQIEGGRWDQIARKLFDIAQPSAVPQLADEVIPTFTIQNWEPELYALRLERLCVGDLFVAGVAAQATQLGLTNPAGSQSLVIVENILLSFPQNQFWAVRVVAEELLLSLGWVDSPTAFRDFRWGAAPAVGVTTARVRGLNAAVAQGVPLDEIFFDAAQSSFLYKRDYVLPPNTSLIVIPAPQNTIGRASFTWRERPFNPQETP